MNAPARFPRADAGDGEAGEMILGLGARSAELYRAALQQALHLVAGDVASRDRPYGGWEPTQIPNGLDPFPERGVGLRTAIGEVGALTLHHGLAVHHPHTMAHLHCPVALPALAAEVLISATNQSLDSWDQSPFATFAEEDVIAWLCRECGFAEGSGSFTSGASQSNLSALHLARERAGGNWRRDGVVLASALAHFSVAKSLRVLGFEEDQLVLVATDSEGRMRPEALEAEIARLRAQGRRALAIVATAGTTDLGAIDPLKPIAELAEAHDIWLHIDAAYGGGLLFSRRFRSRLEGLARADSVALDFHKMLFQPVSCGVLLTRSAEAFAPFALKADYLNPDETLFAGAINHVERSLQTTRRADALKVLLTGRALGRSGLAELIDRTLDNAADIARHIDTLPGFELARQPSLSTILFRYRSSRGQDASDAINLDIRRRLFLSGRAAVATTRFEEAAFLKLTLLNPASTLRAVEPVLAEMADLARELDRSNV